MDAPDILFCKKNSTSLKTGCPVRGRISSSLDKSPFTVGFVTVVEAFEDESSLNDHLIPRRNASVANAL